MNDGISFLNVARWRNLALKDILFRMRELSTQSSNGTFSNAHRQSIDKESQSFRPSTGGFSTPQASMGSGSSAAVMWPSRPVSVLRPRSW